MMLVALSGRDIIKLQQMRPICNCADYKYLGNICQHLPETGYNQSISDIRIQSLQYPNYRVDMNVIQNNDK